MYWMSVKKRDSIKSEIGCITGVSNANFLKVSKKAEYLDGLTAFVAILYEAGVSVSSLQFDSRRSKAGVYRLLKRHARKMNNDPRYTALYEYAKRVANQ